VKLEPRQRSILIVGALIGAVLGAGAAWLLTESVEKDPLRPRPPLRPGDLFKLTSQAAVLLREIDNMRRHV
jgi:hypothetical protein